MSQAVARLVKLSVGGGLIGQNVCGSELDWSNFLLEQAGLVKISIRLASIGQTF